MKQLLIVSPDYKNHWNENLKSQEYHGDKTAVNSSSLKTILKSPLAFHNLFFGEPAEPTEAMKFGTLAHLALLQGDVFKARYVVMPEFESFDAKGNKSESKNTKYYKDQVEQWKKEIPIDAVIVTKEEKEKLFGIINSILNHKIARNLIKNGKPEICGYWRDPVTGILCRMQADFISFDGDTLVDVKTTQDCSPDAFKKSIQNFNYPFQMAMYAEGIKNITGKKPTNIVWLAVESKPPYECRAYLMSPHYEAIGEFDYRRAMDLLKVCIDKNEFKGAQKEIEIIEPNTWFIKKYAELGAFESLG